jgi:hypothetical protein
MTVAELVDCRAKLLDEQRPGWFADVKPDLLVASMIRMWPYTHYYDMTDNEYAFAELCDFEAEDCWRQEIARRCIRGVA